MAVVRGETFRWLHLSDFHVGKDRYGERRLFTYILEHVRRRVDESRSPDAVFITGDIANKGLASEYIEFNDQFFWPLVDILPTEVSGHIYIVPGNHDVDRLRVRAVNTYDVLRRVPEFFDPNEAGAFERRTIYPRFESFANADPTTHGDHWLSSDKGTLQRVITIGRRRVAVVGLNSAWLSAGDDDRHRLSLGKGLLEDALSEVSSCDIKIVLGHHPLEWMLDADISPLKVLLGKQAALYLCGHLHRPAARPEDTAGGSFLTLQAGASFQAREEELWVNRLLWCQIAFDSRELTIEPRTWSRDNQEWALEGAVFPERYRQGDVWALRLPTPLQPESAVGATQRRSSPGIPAGWLVVDFSYLDARRTALTPEQALSYFDGRSPAWRDVLSGAIPRRTVVTRVLQQLKDSDAAAKTLVLLLTGASGEGKTTTLLQVAADVATGADPWTVLWHEDTSTPFPTDFMVRLPVGHKWLIVSDDAELICPRVYDAARELSGSGRRDVHFLLCGRDTDWRAAGGFTLPWRSYARFVIEALRGLSEADAASIVNSWAAFGEEGLGALAGVPLDQAATQLMQAAKSEVEAGHEGSLFGALLHVRRADGLHEHLDILLHRLREYDSSEVNYVDALTFIAAMHAEGLLILTKEVLAKALRIPTSELRRLVLGPLGDEAVIATTGRHVFTRHRAIAETMTRLLIDRFSLDTDEVYAYLTSAALAVGLSGSFIPSFDRWRFIGSHFFEKGDHGLGIRLGQLALAEEPGNPFLVDKLSQMYREGGEPKRGVELYRNMVVDRPTRSYYFEWGQTEAAAGNLAMGLWLVGYSISDQCPLSPVDRPEADMKLYGFATIGSQVRDRYRLPNVNDGVAGALCLREAIRSPVAGESAEVGPEEIAGYFEQMREAALTAFEYRELKHAIEGRLSTQELSFRNLARLARGL